MSRRYSRRQTWLNRELPALLVRLRFVAPPEVVQKWVGAKYHARYRLRELVAYWERESQLTHHS